MVELGSCPLPFRDYDKVTIAHGGGGVLTQELIQKLFIPAFGDAAADATPTDAATLAVGAGRIAFTTDSYVVRPLFFPGGDIGQLSVHGTVNDLAMAGAQPLALSTAFVLEEGLEMGVLHRIATSMGAAATAAGVGLVTGDTKVVDAGLADGMYITTAGVGVIPDGVDLRPERVVPGDAVILSGTIGRHGTAVMSVREGLEFGTELVSDSAPLNGLVESMLSVCPDIHALRDLTRGGMAAALCEIAEIASVGVRYVEAAVPVPPEVDAACGFLGLDPIHVANEGRLVAFAPAEEAEALVVEMPQHELGADAVIIGEVTEENAGVVTARTALGTHRIVDQPLGEQLPRIC
ncbi:MAG: hydrogenase expression/formation protein HypE [Acidimicrobiales bacterium]|nr:MAG: hydrogenase expression/formation protein HypE [Acidimicrobiales bacterium]